MAPLRQQPRNRNPAWHVGTCCWGCSRKQQPLWPSWLHKYTGATRLGMSRSANAPWCPSGAACNTNARASARAQQHPRVCARSARASARTQQRHGPTRDKKSARASARGRTPWFTLRVRNARARASARAHDTRRVCAEPARKRARARARAYTHAPNSCAVAHRARTRAAAEQASTEHLQDAHAHNTRLSAQRGARAQARVHTHPP